MAKKQPKTQKSNQEISDLLDSLTKLIDRTKVLYEQYFMGIQKIPPSQLHRDIERSLRELTQANLRNTALRFRLATLTQKFGSYNTYWRRVMREIEQGRYVRDVARAGRRAARTGKEIPEEMLAKMPKRMRERILRDRAAVEKRAQREAEREAPESGRTAGNVHQVDDSLLGDDLDLDAMFADITTSLDAREKAKAAEPAKPSPGSGVRMAPPKNETPKAQPAKTQPTKTQPAKTQPASAKAKPPASAKAKPPARPPAKKPPPPPPIPGKAAARAGTAKPRAGSAPPARAATASPSPPARAAAPKARAPSARPKPRTAKPGSSLPPGLGKDQSRQLFERYVKAQQLVGKRTDNLSYDKLMRSLSKQAPAIMNKHKAAGVDWRVVIKEDKVVLKAKPIKKGDS